MEQLKTEYNRARRRLLLLDYDGVLVPLAPTPEAAAPTPHVLQLLRSLVADQRNTVVIISGRPPETMEQWLGKTGVDMSAEHGHFIKIVGQRWQQTSGSDSSWKAAVRERMDESVRAVPASHIEEKHTGLVWHYRQSPAGQAEQEALVLLKSLQSVPGLNVSHGAKIVEARLSGTNKGQAASRWLSPDFDFVLAAGDDTTDEDLFAAMPKKAYSIKIGPGPSAAKLRLDTPEQFVSMLKNLSNKE